MKNFIKKLFGKKEEDKCCCNQDNCCSNVNDVNVQCCQNDDCICDCEPEDYLVTTLEEKVSEIIERLCENLESFTSLDVSNAVKSEGFSSSRHRDIAPIVRKIMLQEGTLEDFDYVKTNIVVNLPGGNTTIAFLYHHETVDASEYDNVSQEPIKPQGINNHQTNFPNYGICVPTVDDSEDDEEQDDGDDDDSSDGSVLIRNQKADGRLEIPTCIIPSDWGYGTKIAAVEYEHNGDVPAILLKPVEDLEPEDIVLDIMKVNVDKRLRLTKTAFSKSNISDTSPSSQKSIIRLDNYIVVL